MKETHSKPTFEASEARFPRFRGFRGRSEAGVLHKSALTRPQRRICLTQIKGVPKTVTTSPASALQASHPLEFCPLNISDVQTRNSTTCPQLQPSSRVLELEHLQGVVTTAMKWLRQMQIRMKIMHWKWRSFLLVADVSSSFNLRAQQGKPRSG